MNDMREMVSDDRPLSLNDLSEREIWELKGFDAFGNLTSFQELKIDKSAIPQQEYVLDALSEAVARGAVKIILEKASRKP